MAFWPTAAAILVYSEVPSNTNLAALLVLMFTSSMMYLTLRHVKTAIEGGKKKTSVRRNVSRSSKELLSRKFLFDISDNILNFLPDNTTPYRIVAFCILVNFFGGVGYFWVFANRVISSSDPNAATVGLTALPVLYGFAVVSTFIWNY